MGYERPCTLTTEGRTFEGVAHLEEKELVFRGDARLVIPLARIGEVHARAGSLFVTFGVRRAVFELGREAEKWANRIARPPARLDKLGIKPGMRVAVINVGDDDLLEDLGAIGARVENSRTSSLDAIFFGAGRPEDLAKLTKLVPRIAPAGAIWLVREKGRSATVTEAQSMAAGKQAGLVDVKVVSFSATHTAEKYVIPLARREPAARPSSSAARKPRSASSRGRS